MTKPTYPMGADVGGPPPTWDQIAVLQRRVARLEASLRHLRKHVVTQADMVLHEAAEALKFTDEQPQEAPDGE